MAPSDSPEVLFYRIEECQEVQIIGKVPFTTKQIIVNAVRILIGSNLLLNKEFDAWEALPIKTWATLKTFFQAAYGRRLTSLALRSTSGQNGYANQMMYNVFEGIDEDTDDDTVTTITPITTVAATATATTGMPGMAQPSIPASITSKIAAAIKQLSQNLTAIMSQMAALSFMPAPATPHICRTIANVPPIQQLAVPIQQQFPAGDFSVGRGARRSGRGCGRGRGGRGKPRSRTTCERKAEQEWASRARLSPMGAALHRSRQQSKMAPRRLGILINQTSTSATTTGTFAFRVVLTLKMGTPP